MSESKKPWVPGFVELTAFTVDRETGQTVVTSEPMLLAISVIEHVMLCAVSASRGINCSSLRIKSQQPWDAIRVLETPDQVAALIREEWRRRVMNEAIVRAEYGSGQYPVEGNVDEREA